MNDNHSMKKIVNKIREFDTLLKKHTDQNNFDTFDFDKYYRLYEYTDDICVIEDRPLYPGLMNYVKTGLLTKDELVDALLYDEGLKQ